MTCHGNVTRDNTVTVTRDSRVVSHTLSQCPDPTRPDPLLTKTKCLPLGRPISQAANRLWTWR